MTHISTLAWNNTQAIDASSIGSAKGSFVVYDYTPPPPAPEPTTIALLGSALVGFGVFRKRFKR
jgi:hypothetical protein